MFTQTATRNQLQPARGGERPAICRDRIAGCKRPRRVVVDDTLPHNAGGKILERTVREEYAHLGKPPEAS